MEQRILRHGAAGIIIRRDEANSQSYLEWVIKLDAIYGSLAVN
jgi:hypothetical protein